MGRSVREPMLRLMLAAFLVLASGCVSSIDAGKPPRIPFDAPCGTHLGSFYWHEPGAFDLVSDAGWNRSSYWVRPGDVAGVDFGRGYLSLTIDSPDAGEPGILRVSTSHIEDDADSSHVSVRWMHGQVSSLEGALEAMRHVIPSIVEESNITQQADALLTRGENRTVEDLHDGETRWGFSVEPGLDLATWGNQLIEEGAQWEILANRWLTHGRLVGPNFTVTAIMDAVNSEFANGPWIQVTGYDMVQVSYGYRTPHPPDDTQQIVDLALEKIGVESAPRNVTVVPFRACQDEWTPLSELIG